MVANPQPPRESIPNIHFTAVARFDGMTWADLRKFVALAEQNGVRDSETVELYYENDDFYSPLGLEMTFFDTRSGD